MRSIRITQVYYRFCYELVLVIVYLEIFSAPPCSFPCGVQSQPVVYEAWLSMTLKAKMSTVRYGGLNPHLIWTFTQVPFLSQDCTLRLVVGSSKVSATWVPWVFLVFMRVGGWKGLVSTLDTVALGASHFPMMRLELYILGTTPQQWHYPPQSTVSGGMRPVCVINGDVTFDHKEEAMSSNACTIEL